jgi:putative DNA primase/helicase
MVAVIEAAAYAANDEEWEDRVRAAQDTLVKHANGQAVTGAPTLDQLAPGVPKDLDRWLKGTGERSAEDPPTPNGGSQRVPTHDELRDRWMEQHPHRAYSQGEWRHYDPVNGLWVTTHELSVKSEITTVVEAAKPEGVRPTAPFVSSVTEMAKAKVHLPDEIWDADPDVLLCANGALHLPTLVLQDHDPARYATSAVPYAYDPDAVAPVWSGFIKKTLQTDVARFVQEFAGYAITTDTSHELALWLLGPRGCGKSTFLAGLRAMLGPRAGVLGLAEIERSRFALADLRGKTLVTATEQPSSFLASTHTLNAIISGEPLPVEQKYRDPYTLVPHAKIAWAMNELPRIAEANSGLFRRVKVIQFPPLEEGERDPEVKRGIEGEGAGILNWAIEGLRRLQERGRFDIPRAVEEATTEFQLANDVPALFLEDRCERNKDDREQAAVLYDAYKMWCEKNGHRCQSSTRVAGDWERLGLERYRPGGKTYYRGIRLKACDE